MEDAEPKNRHEINLFIVETFRMKHGLTEEDMRPLVRTVAQTDFANDNACVSLIVEYEKEVLKILATVNDTEHRNYLARRAALKTIDIQSWIKELRREKRKVTTTPA